MKASVIVALTAVASALSIGLAQADGTDVRTSSNYDRPGRSIDADMVKVVGASAKPSRAIDDNGEDRGRLRQAWTRHIGRQRQDRRGVHQTGPGAG